MLRRNFLKFLGLTLLVPKINAKSIEIVVNSSEFKSEPIERRETYEFILNNKEDINYKKIISSNLIFIGESHDIDLHRKEVEVILENTNTQNVLFEALPGLEDDYINKYQKNENQGENFINYFKARFSNSVDSYFNLIQYFKLKGIKIIGIEREDFSNSLMNQDLGKTYDSRNNYWASKIYPIKNQNSIIFFGSGHMRFLKNKFKNQTYIILSDSFANNSFRGFIRKGGWSIPWDHLDFDTQVSEFCRSYWDGKDFMINYKGVYYIFKFPRNI